MSPVPTHASRPAGGIISHSQRGTSPVTTSQPMRPHNTREMQQAVQQQLQMHQAVQASHIFPENGTTEPPPPYPMGSAAANPPPSYSQSFAIQQRQSPTLSSTSSDNYRVMTSADYRRSPAPNNHHMMTGMAAAFQHTYNGHTGHGPSPIPTSPSPSATSMMSGSSRTSSTLPGFSARQMVTQSPVIMQKVQSVQVQKPRLQTAKPIAPVPTPSTPTSAPMLPPPSYEKSLQTENCPSPVINQVPRTLSPAISEKGVPPPPPYPSTAVASSKDLVNPAINQQVISTAKVVNNKPVLQRKYSPMVSEASSNSRSESPISEQTISSENTVSCSPSSCHDITITDSGIENQLMPPPPPPAYGKKESTTHISSPKPERRQISPAKEEARKSFIKECPPQAFKFYMESHIDNVWKEHTERQNRREELMTAFREMKKAEEAGNPLVKEYNKDQFLAKMQQFESNYLRMKRLKKGKLTIKDFDIVKRIGVGGFGEVNLVRKKVGSGPIGHVNATCKPNNIYAMKTLMKSLVLRRKQVAHVLAERDILSEANNEWIVKLHYSFQVRLKSDAFFNLLNLFFCRTKTISTLSWSTYLVEI